MRGHRAETFAGDAFQPVPQDCAAGTTARDRNPQACVVGCAGGGQDQETVGRESAVFCEDATVLSRGLEPSRRVELQDFGSRYAGSESWLGALGIAATSADRLKSRYPADYGVRRMRPFARRALRTFRPFRVALRARNPWLRARFRRLGWKVRFMFGSVNSVIRVRMAIRTPSAKARKDNDFLGLRQPEPAWRRKMSVDN
jgi:hypothetical protein